MKVKTNTVGDVKVPTADKNGKSMEDRLRELNDKLSDLDVVIEDMGITLDFLEDLRDELNPEDEDEFDFDEDDDLPIHFRNDDKIVMVLFPGKHPQLLKAWEACELMPCFCEKISHVEDFLGIFGLNLYYREDQIMTVGGEEFLIGPAVVCSMDCAVNLRSVTAEEIYCVNRYVDHHEKEIKVDGKKCPALRLPL